MSSTLAYSPAFSFSQSSRPYAEPGWHTRHDCREQIKSWQSLAEEGRFSSCFTSGLPTPSEPKAMTGTALNHHLLSDNTSQNKQIPKIPVPVRSSAKDVGARQLQDAVAPHPPTYTGTPHHSPARSGAPEKSHGHIVKHRSNLGSAIATYLQIPTSINSSKGSLAEFAAEVTCLFWFESAATLERAEEPMSLNATPVKPLAADAFPTMGFFKWVTTILTTTQVTQNVILLALLFIHRLRKFNPTVSGKKGSEYRLLTIALMLGNKFLDDNTYTNKTWAEVSGISVSEIHIMEVEFLSNMRYNLYVSGAEWETWHVKLARFSLYFHQASKPPPSSEPLKLPPPITPLSQTFPYKLPSPPSPGRYRTPLPMYQPSLPNPMIVAPQSSLSPARSYYDPDRTLVGRKRSLDVSTDMPMPKRLMTTTPVGQSPATLSPTTTLAAYTPGSNASSNSLADTPKDISPIPKLPLPTQMPRQHPHLAPLSVSSAGAMSMVYPNASSSWSQPVTPIGTMPPNTMNLFAHPVPVLGEPTRSQYPPTNPSPGTGGGLGSYAAATPSQRQLSPSYFLTNRNSPYRPVRGVNTLLIPPPSTSLQNATRNIGHEQMRYQPLGKAPTEVRAGIVPYLHHDAWPQPWTGAASMPSQYAFHA